MTTERFRNQTKRRPSFKEKGKESKPSFPKKDRSPIRLRPKNSLHGWGFLAVLLAIGATSIYDKDTGNIMDLFSIRALAAGAPGDVPIYDPKDFATQRFAGLYGNYGSGGWGALSEVNSIAEAVSGVESYRQIIDAWNSKQTKGVVNMVARNERPENIMSMINSCAEKNCIVMLDLSPQDDMEGFIGTYANKGSHVWFDVDLEHGGQPMSAEYFNYLVQLYTTVRNVGGYKETGVFAFYDFHSQPWITPVEKIQWQVDNTLVVPIFDGQCGQSGGLHCQDIKTNATEHVLGSYSQAFAYGVMEFTRFNCGGPYGDCGLSLDEYYNDFQPFLIVRN